MATRIERSPLIEVDSARRYGIAPELVTGQIVGEQFVVADKIFDEKRVVAGGNADVYRAVDLSNEEDFKWAVLKVQRNTRAYNYATHFAMEAELTRALSEHTDKVPKFLGAGQDIDNEGNPFWWLATEELDTSFDRVINRWDMGKPDIDKVISILAPALGGVAIVHDELDLAHKDFKPSNVYVGESGEGKIGDFGTAGAAHRVNVQALRDYNIPLNAVTEPLSEHDLIYGTEKFMPPEAMILGNEVDPKMADVWAAGYSLHLAVTAGRQLEEGMVPMNGRMRLERYIPNVDDYDSTVVPRALSRLAVSMMSRDPSQRPTMREATDELLHIQASV